MPISELDHDLLTRTVMAEAGVNASPDEQAAVAHVIMNRLNSGQYGQSVGQVVMARNQFEPWNLPRTAPNYPLRFSSASPGYKKVAGVVDDVISGKTPDPTQGAQYFLAPDIVAQRVRSGQLSSWPSWARGTGLQIGNSIFYKPQPTPTTGAPTDAGLPSQALGFAQSTNPDAGGPLEQFKGQVMAQMQPTNAAAAPPQPMTNDEIDRLSNDTYGVPVAPAAPGAPTAPQQGMTDDEIEHFANADYSGPQQQQPFDQRFTGDVKSLIDAGIPVQGLGRADPSHTFGVDLGPEPVKNLMNLISANPKYAALAAAGGLPLASGAAGALPGMAGEAALSAIKATPGAIAAAPSAAANAARAAPGMALRAAIAAGGHVAHNLVPYASGLAGLDYALYGGRHLLDLIKAASQAARAP